MSDILKWGKSFSDAVKDAANKVGESVQKETQTQREKHEVIKAADGTVAKATEELNVVAAHDYYKKTLDIDLAPHLKDDGKITNEETVQIFTDLAQDLVDLG